MRKAFLEAIAQKMQPARQEVVVSETDLQAALSHLCTLPHVASRPAIWDRQRLLNHLREAIGPRCSIGQCHAIAPGVFAIIKPFGVDLALGVGKPSAEDERRLQVWLAIRPCGTDPNRLARL